MKIAIICSSFFPVIDGVTIAVDRRLKQLSRLGHQAIVFCPDYQAIASIYPDYQKYTGKILPGIEIVSLPSNEAAFLKFERDVTIKSYQIVLDKLSQFKPEIIHVDEAERLGLCWLKIPGIKYARQHNIPCVAWFHTNYIDYLDDYLHLPLGLNKLIKKTLSLIFAKIYNAYDRTLVSSSLTAKHISEMGIKNIASIELLGCDLTQFGRLARTPSFFTLKYNLPSLKHKTKLIFIGRLTPDKGWHFTCKALTKLAPDTRDKLAVIIVGDGELKAEIEQRIKPLIADTYLLGRVIPDSIPELLINSDIFITNSEKETRGLTVIEAAAAGIPAIAPRAGGAIDTIQDGETGWLYQPQSEADFLHKLNLLIDDANLRKSMGNKAKELAQQYSWQQAIDNLIECWQREIQASSQIHRDRPS